PPARGRDEAEAEGGFGKAVRDVLFGTGRRQGVLEASGKQAARTITNQIVRGILGSLLGGRKR
ncbi:ATP-binding protein, partial [Luteimonas sp. SDU101]